MSSEVREERKTPKAAQDLANKLELRDEILYLPPLTQKPSKSKAKSSGLCDVNASESTERDKLTIETQNFKNKNMMKFMNEDE